jgi:hypothetical protein
MICQRMRNKWNVVWESYAGVLLFATDSSLECFTYALNALGYLLSPAEFIDITTDAALKHITPANILDPPTKATSKHSVHDACRKRFPKICKHWSANRALLAQIIQYHDATKHRHSVAVGQYRGYPFHVVKLEPKQPMRDVAFDAWTGHVAYNAQQSLQAITVAYHKYMSDWLRIARLELECVFGQQLPTPH